MKQMPLHYRILTAIRHHIQKSAHLSVPKLKLLQTVKEDSGQTDKVSGSKHQMTIHSHTKRTSKAKYV